MTNEERANKIADYYAISDLPVAKGAALEMAEWKDQQLRERLDFEIEKANAYYDKKLNKYELAKHIGAVIALSESLGIEFPTDRLHMRFATMD